MALIAQCIADGLDDAEAASIADIHPGTLSEWRKDPEFSEAIKKAEALRLRQCLRRVEEGSPGWQSVAWILERVHGARFARPEVQDQIAVVQAGQAGAPGPQQMRVITVPDSEFEVLSATPGYVVRPDGDTLQRAEGNLTIIIAKQSGGGRLISNGGSV